MRSTDPGICPSLVGLYKVGNGGVQGWIPLSRTRDYACHQIIDTRVTGYRLVVEDCNCASVGTGYQQAPPAISAAEKAGFSEVVTAGVAGRILNPRSQGRELKDRCDYSSQIYPEGTSCCVPRIPLQSAFLDPFSSVVVDL